MTTMKEQSKVGFNSSELAEAYCVWFNNNIAPAFYHATVTDHLFVELMANDDKCNDIFVWGARAFLRGWEVGEGVGSL
ncbi:MAG: hypothetical protein MN733_14595 [Nitrososphaera sp.]|nr:hypothetical protein [Nitrososphaera sp.]